MAIPGQAVKTIQSKNKAGSEYEIADLQASRTCSAVQLVERFEREEIESLHAAASAVSSHRTREALLRLENCPADNSAIVTLWKENHAAIEREMGRYLPATSHAALLKRVLTGLVSHSRFFCQEIDDPQVWVARCANLESRRLALQLSR